MLPPLMKPIRIGNLKVERTWASPLHDEFTGTFRPSTDNGVTGLGRSPAPCEAYTVHVPH
jgi:hypothetical protein